MKERDFNQLHEELDSLRRRLEEQGDLLKRTHRHVHGLGESIAQLVSRQRSRDRSVTLNSFVAYLLFTVLLGGAFFALYRTRAGDLVSSREQAVSERDAARARAAELQAQLARRDAAAEQALAYYQLLQDGKRSEAIAQHPTLEEQSLSPTERAVFAAGVARARAELVEAAYASGLEAYRAGNFEVAIGELRRGLTHASESAQVGPMRYHLGLALHKIGQPAEAARELEQALAARVDKTGVGDARFHLAAALEASGERERARGEYERFANANPKSPLVWTARRKSAQLARPAPATN